MIHETSVMLFTLRQRILPKLPSECKRKTGFLNFLNTKMFLRRSFALLASWDNLEKDSYCSILTICCSFKLDRGDYRCLPSSAAIDLHSLFMFTRAVLLPVRLCFIACAQEILSLFLSVHVCIYCICIRMCESWSCGPFYYLNGPRQHWTGTNHSNLPW